MIQRNIQILINSKLSSIILILGPIILIGLVGAALQDTSIKNIIAGVNYQEKDAFVEQFIENLNSRDFTIYEYENINRCKNTVKEGITHVCIEISKIDNSELDEVKNYDVKLYVDFSKQRIVWNIIGNIQGAVEIESQRTRQLLLSDIKDRATEISKEVEDKENEITNIISHLEEIESQLGSIEILHNKATNQITVIKNEIKTIKEDLLSVNKSAGLIFIGQTSAASIIGENIARLDNSEARLNQLEADIKANSHIPVSKSEITYSKTQILETKESLSKIKKELQNIEEFDTNQITDPITLTYKSVEKSEGGEIETNLEFIDYLFPSFLVFFILFTSMLTSTILTIKERSSNAYIRNIASKKNGASFVLSIFVTSFVITAIQATIITIAADYFLNISLALNILSLIVTLALAIGIFTLIGITLGYIFNSYESAITASITIVLLFFVFSSIITPAETLTKTLSQIINLLPLTLLETKLRLILIFNSALNLYTNDIIALGTLSIVCAAVIFVFYQKNKEKEI